MSGYCKDCGTLLAPGGNCSDPGCLQANRQLPENGPGTLPKPSTARRLLGSGIEFIIYSALAWLITGLESASFGLLGLLFLFLIGLIVLRDFNGGLYSIAKRVSHMRVVDLKSGRATSNIQSLLRNSYYLVLLAIAIVPVVGCFSSTAFMVFVALDVMMIMANPQGRRLGDLMAGTQVVQERS